MIARGRKLEAVRAGRTQDERNGSFHYNASSGDFSGAVIERGNKTSL